MNPYRRFTSHWWRSYWQDFINIPWTIKFTLGKIRDYGPVLWRDGDFDQLFLYALLAVKFRRMKEHAERCRIIADWQNQAREYAICAHVMKRLHEDAYFDLDKYVSSNDDDSETAWRKRRRDWKKEEHLRQRDIDVFCGLFRRKVQTWWD